MDNLGLLFIIVMAPIGFLIGSYGQTRIRVIYYTDKSIVQYKEWYHFFWQNKRVFGPGSNVSQVDKFVSELEEDGAEVVGTIHMKERNSEQVNKKGNSS